jgi:ribosomal protein L13
VNTEKPWYIVDASDKILGRLASTISIFIRGKNLATYTPSVDMGAFVIVVCSLHTNAYFFLHDDSEAYALCNINL